MTERLALWTVALLIAVQGVSSVLAAQHGGRSQNRLVRSNSFETDSEFVTDNIAGSAATARHGTDVQVNMDTSNRGVSHGRSGMHLILGIICIVCLVCQALGFSIGRWVMQIEQGTEQMISVGDSIREGSEAYVKTMFGWIFALLLPAASTIFFLYALQEDWGKSLMITFSFVLGAICSSVSGIAGMWSSTRANSRVANTARRGTFRQTIVVALRSGVVAGLIVVSLAVLGISVLFSICHEFVEADPAKVPIWLVGYGFGASFVALFAQLGGGIYTKAADVGADLTGKIELGIPEDDPRNPAVVADLVGDNVGDCCARGADLFESLAAEIIGAMILGGALTSGGQLGDGTLTRFILFPLVVHVADLVVSLAGVMSVRDVSALEDANAAHENPMGVLKRGYLVAVALAALAFGVTTRLLLHSEAAPEAWWHFMLCGLSGMVGGFVIIFITQYYTDFEYQPVKDIAKASESGHGTNVIQGIAVGFESTMLPILVVSAAILMAFYLGRSSGLQTSAQDNGFQAGLFGTAVATMGMLSNLTYVLAMDIFGPITDNAAGIVEMSPEDCPEQARVLMDRLDATGNTTKAFTKGFAVSSAGLACFLLFSAFLDVVGAYSGGKEIVIDIVKPEVFVAGLVGSATVFLFAGFAVKAVSITAQEVVTEVRRQFKEKPGIIDRSEKPEYGKCVGIVATSAINRMVKPGMLVVLMPMLVGGIFRVAGSFTQRPLLGAQCITSYLVCSSMTAMLVAFFLNNAGGAWDNAKKHIEAGACGGKGNDAHKAAVTGDTVGDPCKDTAGPSLHVLMKLTATVTMVVGPLVAVPWNREIV